MKIELINQQISNNEKKYELAFNETGSLIPTGIEVGHFKLNMHLDLEIEGYHVITVWFSNLNKHIIHLKYIVVYVDGNENRIENSTYVYINKKWDLVKKQLLPKRKPDQVIHVKKYKDTLS